MEWRTEMRAADADRETVAERLRTALAEGRLDLTEFDERLGRTYAARTYGDLDGLLDDLPAPAPPEFSALARLESPPDAGWPVPGADGWHRGATRRWLADTWGPYPTVVGITVAIWAVSCLMTGELGYFWPGWVAGPWGAVLLVVTVTGLIGGEPRRWAVKRARERQRKAARRDRRQTGNG